MCVFGYDNIVLHTKPFIIKGNSTSEAQHTHTHKNAVKLKMQRSRNVVHNLWYTTRSHVILPFISTKGALH